MFHLLLRQLALQASQTNRDCHRKPSLNWENSGIIKVCLLIGSVHLSSKYS